MLFKSSKSDSLIIGEPFYDYSHTVILNTEDKLFNHLDSTPYHTNITVTQEEPIMTDTTTSMTLLDQLDGTTDDATNDVVETMGEMIDIAEQFGYPQQSVPITGVHNSIDVPIRILPHGEGLPMPSHQSKLASGFDVYAANDKPIFLNSIGASAVIPTGFAIAVPAGFEAQVRPRSGLAAKHGITVTNTPGTIDADYRGEIKILLTNLSGRRFTVERGMRVAQIVSVLLFRRI